MNNQDILDNAPEGATHVDDAGVYYKYVKDKQRWFAYTDKKGGFDIYQACNIFNLRSLEDVKDLSMLRKQRREALDHLYSEDEDSSYNATCALEGE